MIHGNVTRQIRRPVFMMAVLLVVTLTGCDSSGGNVEETPPPVEDPTPDIFAAEYRPQFHFSPQQNWMNDPNGLVYHEGTYHLFFQHNPSGNQWGNMSWGHAVSTDLVHWKHKSVAIRREEDLLIFSGSAVIDENNTSGFGTEENPPMVAIYTGARPSDGNQSQYIAYSTDEGETWTKYQDNPVIDIGSTEFRDPKVFWHAPDEKWVMLVALPTEHKIQFYESQDLKDWSLMSEFGPAGATGGVWEMPDLFQLPVEGNSGNKRWVLEIDLNPGGVAGGSGAQYFVGSFDGTSFTAQDVIAGDGPGLAGWVDYGKDFYAGLSWNNVPESDGRRIWLAWMNNWQYAGAIPTSPWRGSTTIPRTLSLASMQDGLRLVQRPIAELENQRGERTHLENITIPEGTTSLADEGVSGKSLELHAEFEVNTATEVGLKVRQGDGDATLIGYNNDQGTVFVDRSNAGEVNVSSSFPGRHPAPLSVENGRISLRVLVDWSSVELFARDGVISITERIFPSPENEGVSIYAQGGSAELVSLKAWPLTSIWEDQNDGS